MTKITTLLIILVFLSCNESTTEVESNEFEVTVTEIDMDCNLPIIDFLRTDAARIADLTGSTEIRCYALDLDQALSQTGFRLTVTIQPTPDEDLRACTTFGPSTGYPWVSILGAERLE